MQKINLPAIAVVLLLVTLIIISACSNREEKEDQPEMRSEIEPLFPMELNGWTPTGEFNVYDYDGIYRYINGAGEVYRMYDYREVWVRKYIREGRPPITIEIFDMGKPEDAYGIFLHSTQTGNGEFGQGSAMIGGVLMFWQHRYFVSIYPEEMTPASQEAAESMARVISDNIGKTGNKPKIVDYLPEENQVENSLRYFHLHTSLNYHYYLSDTNFLMLDENTEAALARYHPGRTFMVCIEYQSENMARQALESFTESYIPDAGEDRTLEIETDRWTAIRQHGPFLMVIFDAESREAIENMFFATIANLPES